ncbi:MAG: glycosyltransferase domain-containing protein [Candidatus Paceibacterota bacterium]
MTPRLQAKIPKFFGWQMNPGYDYYVWIDSNLTLAHPDTIKWLLDSCRDVEMVVLRHPKRNTITWEARYIQRAIKEQSIYMMRRYEKEWGDAQMEEINSHKEYVDDLLVNGGIFIYRDTPGIRKMFKEWWYFTSRYTVMDQCAFAYCIKKSGISYRALDVIYNDCPYLQHRKHYLHQ